MKFKFIRGPICYRKKFSLIIMKTLIFLCCALTFGFNPNTGFSQNVKINIDSDREISVIDVFELIKKATDYRFVYKTEDFKNAPKVLLNKGKIKAHNLLSKSLSFGNYTYELTQGKTIVLKKNIPLPSTYQQIIEGFVRDKNGAPLPGANIAVINSNGKSFRGTTSDFDGNYSIKASKGELISFSYLGFITQEIIIQDISKIDIILLENANELEEIILNTGYQKISKEQATGSFQQIGTKVLDTKISQNILSKIEGEVSGILFDDNGVMTIRGLSTINANSEPLIVVDGFPLSQDQDLNSINPNDIKDITVLKDASAASIWGIRAANGVIVIVTKKGSKNGKPKIDISTNFSITPKDNLQDLPYASTNSFLEYEKHRADNEWSELPSGRSQPAYGKGYETYLLLNDGQITQAQADNIINGLRGIDSRKEFSDLFMNDAYWSQYNIGISGGGKDNTYRASVSYNKNENSSFFKENESDQLIASLRNSFELSSKLTLNTDINFTSGKNLRNGMNTGDYTNLFQYQQILNTEGSYISQPSYPSQVFKEEKVAEGYPYNWDYNLKQEFENKDNELRSTSVRLQTSLNYDILDFLSIRGSYQYEWFNTNSNSLFNENTYTTRNRVNTFTRFDTDENKLISHINKGSIIDRGNSISKAHQGRLQLNLDKSFNDGLHKINALLGYELRQELSSDNDTRLYGYNPQSLTSSNVAYGERVTITPSFTRSINDPNSVSESENRFISYYANASYTYNSKYTVSSSIRLDDTNLFGASEEYRNIPLYSFGGKWDISKESFMDNFDDINNLSLRASYGVNGNVDRTTSPFLQAGVSRNPFTDVEFAFISDVKNPALRLEKVFVTNLGLDFGLFNNKIKGSLEYYIRKSEDLLAPVSFPSVYGFNSAVINVGEMENKGLDFNVNVQILQKSALKYNTTLNLSYNKNTVTKVDVPEETVNTYLRREPLVGRPLRYLFSYKNAGLDANGDPLALNENGQIIDINAQTDVNGTLEDAEIVNPDALIYGGTTTPKYYGAWINNISYKKFYFRSLITYKLGHVFKNTDFLDYQNDAGSRFVQANIHKDFDNRWQNPGDENITSIPRIYTERGDWSKAGYSYYSNGNQFVDSASHIRFKEIILGYNFNSEFLNKIGFNNLSLSVQARNLGVINFNKWDKDPESLILPAKPTYTLNFSVNF